MSTDPREFEHPIDGTGGTVTPEAIEAAARAIYDVRDDPYDDDEWDEMDSSDREECMCQARAALSAAAPFIAAQAKAEALREAADEFGSWGPTGIAAANALRNRANNLEGKEA